MNQNNMPTRWLNDIDEMFNPLYDSVFLPNKRDAFSEMEEKDAYYRLSIDVPGVDPRNIKLKFQNQALLISSEEDYKDKNMRRQRSLSYSLNLPTNVDSSKIEANVENGVMDIILPKKETHSKQIPIQSHSSTHFLDKIKKHLKTVNHKTN